MSLQPKKESESVTQRKIPDDKLCLIYTDTKKLSLYMSWVVTESQTVCNTAKMLCNRDMIVGVPKSFTRGELDELLNMVSIFVDLHVDVMDSGSALIQLRNRFKYLTGKPCKTLHQLRCEGFME